MPNCPNCGAKVTEAMSFCPSCGTNLKPAPPPVAVAPAPPPAPAPAPAPSRPEKQEKREKGEKGEKREKSEKAEKHEKRGYGFASPIIAGIVLIVLGFFFYLEMTLNIPQNLVWAYFLIVIGIVIILAVAYAFVVAGRRHPPA